MPEISFTRLENLSGFGTPDLLAYNKKHTFFTVELKVAKGNSVKLSPHQISFHVKHPHNSFILVSSDVYKDEKLYEGSRCLELVACGLRLEACCLSLESIYEKFQRLQLDACRLKPGKRPATRCAQLAYCYLHLGQGLVSSGRSSYPHSRHS